METIPIDIKADGLTLYADIGPMDMPLDDETIKYHCGHLPKTDMEARVMARNMKRMRKPIDFPNISFGKRPRKVKTLTGNRDNPEYRRERIDRKKRRESGLVKISLTVELKDDYDDSAISLVLLKIEEVEKVKSVGARGIIFNLKKKAGTKSITQEYFEEKIYPQIKEALKDHVEKFTGHDFGDVH